MSRACFGAAAVAFVAAFVPTGARAQTVGTKPKVFSTSTSAVAVDFYPDQQGGITPIAETFHIQFVAGLSSMSSSNGPTARASVINPGAGLATGPAQACPLLVSSLAENGFPGADQLQPIVDACTGASWPFMTQADGFTPDNSTDVGLSFGDPNGQLDGRDGSGRATINEDGTSATDATMGGAHVAALPGAGPTGLPLPPTIPKLPGQNDGTTGNVSLFNSGAEQSTTQNFFDGGTAISHAESRVNGVSLFGGLITIDSITSISEVRFAAGANPVGASSTTVQGVKFLGQDATVDDQGLHPVDSSLVGPMNQVLAGLGLSMKLVGATQGFDDKGFMTAQSGGVAIDFLHPVQTGVNLPPPPPPFNQFIATSPTINGEYFVHYNIASVASRALARDLTFGSSTGGSLISPSFTPSLPSTGAKPSGFTGGSVSAPAPTPTLPSESVLPVTTGFLGLDAGKIKFLYLAFTLATLGVCLVPRFALPARLPGPLKA